MTKWKKEKPCLKPFIGCLNCGAREMRDSKDGKEIIADMKTRVYSGFGGWYIQRDKKIIYQGPYDLDFEEYPVLMRFERMARKDPDHDWRAVCCLPLRDATYQRQGRNRWVLIASGPGFA